MRAPGPVLGTLSRWFNWIAAAALTAMMTLVVLNVVLRLTVRPIMGAYEIVGFLGAMTISFGLPYTTFKRGHVAVDLFVALFPEKARGFVQAFSTLLGALLFAVLAWKAAQYGLELERLGSLSQTLKIPYYPLVFGLSLASALTCLVIVLEAAEQLGNTRGT